jgi:membrane fusion protein (multidrug efflux system)
MSRRTWLMLMMVTGGVFALGAVKVLQIQAAIAQASSFQPPPEAVTTILARSEQWPTTLSAIGTVRAVRGVTLSADLPGVVEVLAFDSGRSVREGEVLVRLDARQERAQLAAAEAQRELARVNLERVRGLVGQGIVAQAELDKVSAEHKQAEARVGEIRATIERKQIRAPFAGVLGIRQVDLGQYLNAGDPIVPLQALDPIYVNFSVPQQQVTQVRVGREVRVSASGLDGREIAGRITALDSVVDEATRNVQVQATLANPKRELQPGMFVEARVVTGEGDALLVLPASAISYAPYGDSVFVVTEAKGPGGEAGKVVTQQFVKLGGTRGDQVAVLSGIAAGAEVVSSGAFKLRNGAAVQVNNEVQPANDPRPHPEDN